MDDNARAKGYDYTTGGLTVGIDYHLADHFGKKVANGSVEEIKFLKQNGCRRRGQQRQSLPARSMPQMDGYDLLGHVRELAPEDAAPVIALTARSDAEERQKALKAGFARFLTKPVDPEQLVHEICNVLEPD